MSCNCNCHDTSKLYKYKLTLEDVGKRWLVINGKNVMLSSSIGYVQHRDIGKMVYLRDNHLSMSL